MMRETLDICILNEKKLLLITYLAYFEVVAVAEADNARGGSSGSIDL